MRFRKFQLVLCSVSVSDSKPATAAVGGKEHRCKEECHGGTHMSEGGGMYEGYCGRGGWMCVRAPVGQHGQDRWMAISNTGTASTSPGFTEHI